MKKEFKIRGLASFSPLTLSALLALSAIAAVGPLAAPLAAQVESAWARIDGMT